MCVCVCVVGGGGGSGRWRELSVGGRGGVPNRNLQEIRVKKIIEKRDSVT